MCCWSWKATPKSRQARTTSECSFVLLGLIRQLEVLDFEKIHKRPELSGLFLNLFYE
jgi:hypothetical protein